ncbi:glycoside-pentoside-hexuronide (GPH):cation symporter [Bifidobacterium oedipodis]|uniref:Sodium:solute symporter n=1 Tax=Bifidobacterium oedipodis TaxID=2675322 RepID=A0A7Y0HT64_9BIFI|nr:glycoside-pentoside-hexuronide (GPH):cation symporter [Bifidobacterium sp. DSM 109957]NMM93319.1 sodium:solute symporter [Bifidobacterium sp. DSM 109957]
MNDNQTPQLSGESPDKAATGTQRTNLAQRIAYAFGNLGQAAFYNTMSTFFITYVTTALFINVDRALAARMIAIITSLVVIIRIAEIFLDPLLGNLVDNTNSRWGRFRPWQFIGGLVPAILLVMVFTGLFGLVDVNTTAFMVLFVIVFIALDVIYSLRDISYWGMIPAISSDSRERGIYTSLGTFTGSIGYNGITVIVVPTVSWFTWKFTGQWEQGRTGWACFAIIVALLGLITAWTVAFGTRENQSKLRTEAAGGNPIDAFRAIARNDQLLWVALSYVLYSIANVATTGVLFYQFKYVLGMPDSFSIAGIIPVITGLITTPLYPVLNRRIPRRWLYVAGMCLMIAGYALFIVGSTRLPLVIAALVLFYCPAQTIQMTAILSMTDSIEYGQLKTGHRNEAVTLSVRPMLDKIAGALSNGIVGFVAVAAGMVGSATASDMTPANIATFKTCAYYLPLAGIVLSLVVFLLKVKIDEKMHERIVAQLETKLAAEHEG